MAENENVKRNKRKRKKTFLANARKYGKKGCYGRGSQLDADTYQYFVRILEAYKDGFPSDEEKRIFVNNVFEQTEKEEINCSCNQIGCRVIEMLLPFANQPVMERFMQTLGEDLRPLCSDRFASHVLEALLSECYKISTRQKYEDAEFQDKCFTFAIKISKFLLNNLEDYIWDTYGNHIIRKVFINFARISTESNNKKADGGQRNKEVLEDGGDIIVRPEYIEIVKDYGERLLCWPQFKDLPYSELTSGFLQILLKALQNVEKDLQRKYLKKLLNECFVVENEEEKDVQDGSKLPELFMSTSAMMTLETCIEVADVKMYSKFYKKCFAKRVATLATMRATNFSIQKLIANCQDKEIFEEIFEDLTNKFDKIVDAGHTGVLLELGKMCLKLSTKQGAFVQELMKTFDCLEPEDRQDKFVVCLCKFTSYENMSKMNLQALDKEKLNLHGTLLVQTILDFNKPIKVINSLLSLESNELRSLMCNTMGSHIVDSYVKSKFVGEKSRERFIRRLQGTYQELASTKYGSRSFEAIWSVCSVKFKMQIMNEMSHKESSWSNSEFGRIIASKINLPLYKKNKEEWKNSLNKQDQVKALLDLIE